MRFLNTVVSPWTLSTVCRHATGRDKLQYAEYVINGADYARQFRGYADLAEQGAQVGRTLKLVSCQRHSAGKVYTHRIDDRSPLCDRDVSGQADS